MQPDLATSGGILETKKIGDHCQELGVPLAMHFAGTPVSCMANVHCAAATENFLVMENHSVDIPWWNDLVDGVEKPIVNKGLITVPDKPGLCRSRATSSPARNGTSIAQTIANGAEADSPACMPHRVAQAFRPAMPRFSGAFLVFWPLAEECPDESGHSGPKARATND